MATALLRLRDDEDDNGVPLETIRSAAIPLFGKYSQGASTGFGSSLFSSFLSKNQDSTFGSVP